MIKSLETVCYFVSMFHLGKILGWVFERVIQLLRLQETSYMVKADRLKRLMFRLHDFQYAAMDDDHQQEQQEEYSRSEESWLAVSSGSSNGI
jgi:hypothetical protein